MSLSSVFRSIWRAGKRGAIPPATKGLDERDGIHHAAAENIYGGDFVGQRGALSGRHFKIAGDTAFVTRDGEFQIFLSCLHGVVLNLSFLLEDPQCCHVVLDLLEAGQHGLPIVGDRLIVSSDRLV